MGANVSTVMIVVALAAGLWWGFARQRCRARLQLFSAAALTLAITTLVVEGLRWQLVPWQVLALAVAAAAVVRRWRPGRSRRWQRVAARGMLVIGLTFGSLALLTADGRTGVTGPGTSPVDMALSNSHYLYVVTSASHGISAFEVQEDGSLTPAGSISGLPVGAVGIAAR